MVMAWRILPVVPLRLYDSAMSTVSDIAGGMLKY
jgi:hypothetical protein